ncbi:MAG: septum site-determining protein MinC, partial [Succinatimonas sp.]|nr:septum site-determining protein MinC [Succinatimonas sp.]
NTIVIKDLNLEHLEQLLTLKVSPNREFYAFAPLVLDVSAVSNFEDLDYKKLVDICNKFDIYLIGLSGITSEGVINLLKTKKVPVVNSNRFVRIREENLQPKIITKTFEVEVPVKVNVPVEVKISEPLIVISRNVRTGEIITAKDNSVVIFGNVAATARIIASHNIIIFGSLFGEAYAGSPKNAESSGYEPSFIYTSGTFKPTLCAICGNYQTADDMEHDSKIIPFYGKKQELLVYLSKDGKSLQYSHPTELNKLNSKF